MNETRKEIIRELVTRRMYHNEVASYTIPTLDCVSDECDVYLECSIRGYTDNCVCTDMGGADDVFTVSSNLFYLFLDDDKVDVFFCDKKLHTYTHKEFLDMLPK